MAADKVRADDQWLRGETGRAVRPDIEAAAVTDFNVMLLGGTPADRRAAARTLHRASRRARQTFLTLTCRGLSEALLETELLRHFHGISTGVFSGNPDLPRLLPGGTLFVDEPGEMSPRLQSLLLRFTDARETPNGYDDRLQRLDVRLITGASGELYDQVEDGTFGRDLYYRLNVIRIEIPPLRNRSGNRSERTEASSNGGHGTPSTAQSLVRERTRWRLQPVARRTGTGPF